MERRFLRQATLWLFALVILVAGAGFASERRANSEGEDSAISAKVSARLAAHREVGSSEIAVETIDGVVTLSGDVETKSIRDKAAKLAFETRGVREVRNRIQVVEPGEASSSKTSGS